MLSLIVVIILSYLVGSFPTALLVGKYFKGIDVRGQGSKNMGSTNAFRVLGWKLGMLVQAIDVLKGIIATLWISKLFTEHFHLRTLHLSGYHACTNYGWRSSCCGHTFSVFANFRGGKNQYNRRHAFKPCPIDASISIEYLSLCLFLRICIAWLY
jgi:glycerol-3-phosphate acyltransferase PlsY